MSSTDPNMPPTPRELTLIVAATNKMGIGLGGTLPWTGLKKEMAYFARVTKRASPSVCIFPTPILELR
jgi:dihydrofolate reductase